MSRASIFDLLHQRQPISEPETVASPVRDDYDADRLQLLDGVALTSAGLVSYDSLPEAHTPALSSSLCGADGYGLLVHEITGLAEVSEPELARLETKALRLHKLVQSALVEALMLLDRLPEETGYDVVLSAPVASGEAAGILIDRLRAVIADTHYGDWLGEIRHSQQGSDPHTTLASPDGGMPYVLWISVDSVANDKDLVSPELRNVLVQNARGKGLYPGEAAAAVLLHRLTEEGAGPEHGWTLERAMVHEHPPRATRRDYEKRKAMSQMLGEFWPEDDTLGVPSRIVIDAFGLPGRAVEVGGATIERWPEIDTIDDGIGVDGLCGWVGEAVTALMLVLALAELKPQEHAVILGVHAERCSRMWALRGPVSEATDAGEDHS